MPRLRDQDRAVAACKAVTERINSWRDDGKKRWEYRQELQQLPSRILASGLGQTLAFYASKGGSRAMGDAGNVHAAVGSELARFLIGGAAKSTLDLLNDAMGGDAAYYRRRTREALAYAEWLKRYAAALIEKPKDKSEGRGEDRS